MNVLIVGAGSIGLLLASRMAASHVTLCTRTKQQAETISDYGLVCEGETTAKITRINVIHWEQLLNLEKKWDVILLTMKQTQLTDSFVQSMKTFMHNGTIVVAFQNGLGHEQLLQRYICAEQLWLAISTEGANRYSANKVIHTGLGIIAMGPIDNPILRQALWHKLIVNAVINPLTAIHRISNGALLLNDAYIAQMRQLFEEAVQIATLEGITIRDDHWQTVLEICRRTAKNESSMLQDLNRGKETEIANINGYILSIAHKHQIHLPAHLEVVNLII
ncbi:MAG: hypothetical protein RLZZ267_1276 [Bacillota bacterium]